MNALIGNPAAESQYLAGEREFELQQIREEEHRSFLIADAAALEISEAVRSGELLLD